MAVPTELEIKEYLEGYGITKDVISDEWIRNRRDNQIIPFIERYTRLNFSSETEYTEYISGSGHEILTLSRKPVNEIVSITYISGVESAFNLEDSVELDSKEGLIIKKTNTIVEGNYSKIFYKGNKNIKVVYKAGYDDFVDPVTSEIAFDIKEAIIMLTARKVLIQIGARTGGGSMSTQSWSRNYGNKGKYTDIINDLERESLGIIRNYATGIVGS